MGVGLLAILSLQCCLKRSGEASTHRLKNKKTVRLSLLPKQQYRYTMTASMSRRCSKNLRSSPLIQRRSSSRGMTSLPSKVILTSIGRMPPATWHLHARCRPKAKRQAARTSWEMWWSMITCGGQWSIASYARRYSASTASPRSLCFINNPWGKRMLVAWGARPFWTVALIFHNTNNGSLMKIQKQEMKSSKFWRKGSTSCNEQT